MKIFKNKEYTPCLHPVMKIECVKNEEEAVQKMKTLREKIKETGVVLSETCEASFFDTRGVIIENERFENKIVSFTYSSPHESYVVLSNTFYPGWKLKVNGNETPIERVNYAFQGLKLPKGEKMKIEVIYDPLSFKVGFIISLLSLMVSLLILRRYKNHRL